MNDPKTERPLFNVDKTAQLLGVSKMWLYRLPPETPGVYCLGRSKRFDPEELKTWGRGKASAGNDA